MKIWCTLEKQEFSAFSSYKPILRQSVLAANSATTGGITICLKDVDISEEMFIFIVKLYVFV